MRTDTQLFLISMGFIAIVSTAYNLFRFITGMNVSNGVNLAISLIVLGVVIWAIRRRMMND